MTILWAIKKQCGTCEYWDGPRETQSDPRVVRCDNAQVMGTCNGMGHNRGRQVQAGLHCGGKCWRCWHCLRER